MTGFTVAIPDRPGGTGTPIRVLLVDPLWSFLGSTLELLYDEGLTVTVVSGSGAALAMARAEPYPVVVIDLLTGEYGGMHAIQVAGALMDLDPAPRIVFVSASTCPLEAEVIRLNYKKLPVVPKHSPAELAAVVRAAHAEHRGVDTDDDKE